MLKVKINGSKSEIRYDMIDVSNIAYADETKDKIIVSCNNHKLINGSVVRFARQGKNSDAYENAIITVENQNEFLVDTFKPYEITVNDVRMDSIATGFDTEKELVYRSAFVLELPDFAQFIATNDFDYYYENSTIPINYYDSDEDDESYKCPGDIITFNGLVYKTDENGLDEHNRYIFPNDPSESLNYKNIDVIFFNDNLQRECVVSGGIMPVDDYGNYDNTKVYFFYEHGSEKETLLRYVMLNMPYISLTTTDNRFYTEVDGELSFITNLRGIQESYAERKIGDYRISIPIASDITNNTCLEDIQQQFLTNKVEETVNSIVDYEKRQFEPVRYNYSNIENDGDEYYFNDNNFTTINEIIFNLHFRERYDDLNEGKEWATKDIDGWNNYFISKDNLNNPILVPKQSLNLTDADVLRYLNFTDSDVYFQKNNLKKSFIRLLFYDSPNRGKQVLQYYSTIFFDTADTFSKYVKAKTKNEDDEGYEEINDESTYYVSNEYTENKDLRLCARFKTYSNKDMKHSSDGFYAYLFPSLIEGTLPSDLYLKIEFNHAKYGRTIPFILPTYEYENTSKEKKRILPIDPTNPSASGGHYFPIHYMKLNNETGEYSEVDFQRALDDMYINIKIKYDEKNNRYVWFFPRPKMEYEENTQIILNLFEPRLNGYEKLPSQTIYDTIPSSPIQYYTLNIALQKYYGNTMGDFKFTVNKDGEIICQRVVKNDNLNITCQIEKIEYTSNTTTLTFIFEMLNNMNNTTVNISHLKLNNNLVLLTTKSLNGRYNTEISYDIDLPSLIENNTLTGENILNLTIECKQ